MGVYGEIQSPAGQPTSASEGKSIKLTLKVYQEDKSSIMSPNHTIHTNITSPCCQMSEQSTLALVRDEKERR